jgi:hypothetical protein
MYQSLKKVAAKGNLIYSSQPLQQAFLTLHTRQLPSLPSFQRP